MRKRLGSAHHVKGLASFGLFYCWLKCNTSQANLGNIRCIYKMLFLWKKASSLIYFPQQIQDKKVMNEQRLRLCVL